jgi:chromosome partitioning protein
LVIRFVHREEETMQTIVFAGSKRGAGKTTLAIELAACAENAMILDLHPEHSVTAWAQRRGSDWPVVQPVDAGGLVDALESARHSQCPWVFVDTSVQARPNDTTAAIEAADLVLVPSHPGSLDLATLREIVCVIPRRRSSAIVLNGCIPFGGGIRDQLLRQAFQEARRWGLPVAPCAIAERIEFSKAFNNGRSVIESEPDSKAAADVLRLWNWLAREAEVLVA